MSHSRSPSAKARAYDFAKHAVLARSAARGSFLTEEEVASALGVSRTPVREALLRLEAEHLIELVPHRGAFIPPVSSHEVADVIGARRAIEAFALADAADLVALGASLELLLAEQRAHADDAEGFIACDRAFHQSLVEASGNRVLATFYDSLRDRMLRMGIVAIHRRGDRAHQVLEEHEAIVLALQARDRVGATRALDDHLRITLALLTMERP